MAFDFPNTPAVGQTTNSPSGEFKWDGVKWTPVVASTGNPGQVNVKDFGAAGNATYASGAGALLTTVTANGTNVITAGSISGTPAVGQNIASANWHSLGSAAFPFPTTVTAISGSNITVSQNIPTGTYASLVTWTPIKASTVTGTDDTIAIKSAIDHALQNNIPDVYMPPGTYLISDTLQLGYGEAYHTVHLIGADRPPYAVGFAGASIISIAPDRPAINVQGGRMCLIKGIQLVGPNANYPIWAQGYSNALSSDPLDWLDPSLHATGSTPGGLQQNTPLAGITIDAFSGTAPAAPYFQAVPPWTGLTGTYNRQYSSDTTIRECYVQGFGVNIAVGLNTATQGDFLRIIGGQSAYSVYGTSVGNTQSRNVMIQNHNFLGLNTFLDNVSLGMQQGALIGAINNCSGSTAYRLFNINTTSSDPIRISNFYVEVGVLIGAFNSTSAVSGSVLFDSCFFYLDNMGSHGQIPPGYITASGGTGITLQSCMILGNNRMNTLVVGNWTGDLIVNNCDFYSMATDGPNGSVALQTAINYSGGMLPGASRYNPQNVNTTRYIGNVMSYYSTTATSSAGARTHGDDLNFTGLSRIWLTPVARTFVDSANRRWNFQKPVDGQLTVPGSGQVTVGPTWTNDTMTFTLVAYMYNNPPTNIQVGWILYHCNSGTIFVVTAVGAADGSGNFPITTVQQNNIVTNPNTGAFVRNTLPDAASGFVNPLSGITVVIQTTFIVPQQVEYGTFTAGSTAVANVHRGDGYAGDLTTWFSPGDQIWAILYNDTGNPTWPIASNGLTLTVNTVTNGSPGSMVLSGAPDYSGRFPVYPVCITGMSPEAATRGVNDASNVAAGIVGEVLSGTQGTATSLTTATALNLVTLSLSAGDWTVNAVATFTPSAVATGMAVAVSQTSATLPTAAQIAAGSGVMNNIRTSFTSAGVNTITSGPVRINVSATTNVYLVVNAIFASGTMTATGYISARRMR